MALDKPQAVPVDVHVWQIAQRDYSWHPTTTQAKGPSPQANKELGNFFRSLWGPYAGWAQAVSVPRLPLLLQPRPYRTSPPALIQWTLPPSPPQVTLKDPPLSLPSPDSSEFMMPRPCSPRTLVPPHATTSPTSSTGPNPSVPSPHTDSSSYPRCCSALTCTIPTKLRSHQQSAERDPQGPKARWGHWTKGFPNTFPLHSPLLSSIQPHVGKGAPCSYLRGQAPANQAVCTAVWGRVFLGRQSYLWFYPLLFITRRNNKIETFVWKMQWKSGRERDGEGMGQDNSPVQGGKGSRLLPNPPTQGILTLDSRS